jgi:DNA repair exonuclease SbcCD ATPase subunit
MFGSRKAVAKMSEKLVMSKIELDICKDCDELQSLRERVKELERALQRIANGNFAELGADVIKIYRQIARQALAPQCDIKNKIHYIRQQITGRTCPSCGNEIEDGSQIFNDGKTAAIKLTIKYCDDDPGDCNYSVKGEK